VLVTGAAGFVGSHLLDLLGQDQETVIAWQRPGTQPINPGRARWMTVEMLDRDAVRRAVAEAQPGRVYHLAGSAHVADSWTHVRETFEGNVLATHHLLRGLAAEGLAPRVVIAGSATVYRPSESALTEDDEVLPASPYATSKLAQEMVARQAWQETGVPVLLARSFNHVGPRQTPAYVAPSIARQVALIEHGALEPSLRMGSLDPRRDVMDVRDTVRAYRAMIDAAEPGVTYNVCGGRAVRIGDLVQMFLDRARVPITVERDPSRMRPNDVPVLVGSHARLTARTGWAPQIALEQTVEDLLQWWRGEVEAGRVETERGS
jgi:GDP-4-dehydro-6-deoxy-D-mannose reductase